MHIIGFILGLILIFATLIDAFETILLPRRINHRLRLSRIYYRNGWRLWRRVATSVPSQKWREALLGVFGPLSMLGLFVIWVATLIIAFALLQRMLPDALFATSPVHAPASGFFNFIYFSGSTFFTLGLGDIAPTSRLARTLAFLESGLGLGFLALIIAYLPVLYQAFSRREVTISLMDARAGSPPSGAEFLLRFSRGGRVEAIEMMLLEWERWSAELLESSISFPVLTYYRSQHSNQSWLSALATMLDASAVLLAILPDTATQQAELTLAMARHAAVDIALLFGVRPRKTTTDRLPAELRLSLHQQLNEAGRATTDTDQSTAKLIMLRDLYEPFLESLADHFVLTLPPMLTPQRPADNWRRSAWMPQSPGIGELPIATTDKTHFD